jgi:hypothetical protein
MNNDNYSLLQDLYLLVTATDILNENKRRELIKFLDGQIAIEEDVMFEHPNEFPVWDNKYNRARNQVDAAPSTQTQADESDLLGEY